MVKSPYPLYLVFDVESVGLHGEGFAVGFAVVGAAGVLGQGGWACPPDNARGGEEGRAWVRANVPPLNLTHETPEGLREQFWGLWFNWRDRGAVLAADVPWPVEARFLAAAVDKDPAGRQWQGPYPLVDVASVLLGAGRAPLEVRERRPDELPVHDPRADALQSARILSEVFGWGVKSDHGG